MRVVLFLRRDTLPQPIVILVSRAIRYVIMKVLSLDTCGVFLPLQIDTLIQVKFRRGVWQVSQLVQVLDKSVETLTNSRLKVLRWIICASLCFFALTRLLPVDYPLNISPNIFPINIFPGFELFKDLFVALDLNRQISVDWLDARPG